MKNISVVVMLMLLLSACGINKNSQSAQHKFATSANSWVFKCDEGEVLLAQTKGQAALVVQGKLYLMRQVPSASGVKLVSLDEQAGLRWYGKGQEGFLRFMAADHTAKEQPVFNHCKIAKAL